MCRNALQVTLDANGVAPDGDCYDVATGLKVFVGMAALVPKNASEPVIVSPLSTIVGIGAIIGVPEAVSEGFTAHDAPACLLAD